MAEKLSIEEATIKIAKQFRHHIDKHPKEMEYIGNILRQIRCDKCEIVLAYNYNFIKREDNYRKGYADGHQSAIHKIHSMIKGE